MNDVISTLSNFDYSSDSLAKARENLIYATFVSKLLNSGKISSSDLDPILNEIKEQLGAGFEFCDTPTNDEKNAEHLILKYNLTKDLCDLYYILKNNNILFTINLSDKESEVLFTTNLDYDDYVRFLIRLIPMKLGDIINNSGKAVIATCIIHDGRGNYSDLYE